MIQRGIKVKRAGFFLGIPISSLYYKSLKAEQDNAIARLIQELAFKYTFYGYRRIHLAVKKQGIRINHKKVYRIYKSLDLQRQKPRKNKKVSMPQIPLTEPQYPNHLWAVDFLFDSLTTGRIIKFITVEDIFSRFCPGIDVQFSIPARIAVEVLEKCFGLFGIPRIIRTDQGPEFRSLTFQKFLQKQGIRHEFIEKASPWQNGNLESFNGKFRDECLNRNLFDNIPQTKEVIAKYRKFYNTERPHSSLDGKTPAEVYTAES